LAQWLPPSQPGMRACCFRCGIGLRRRTSVLRSNQLAAALALGALILYPLAVTLPMLRVEQFGHRNDSSILTGIATLLASGHLFVGIIVLLCSIVFPLGKLVAMLALTTAGFLMRREHRALTYRLVEWTGRWGMLDVLLVALLVAVLKLGDFVEVSAGPAAFAFTCCVVLSLLATAAYDPHGVWQPTDE
jgi:paraquat-inducible protein A